MMFDFNEMIHEERSKRLRALPHFTGTVLSAGCSGTWYFKWFEDCTGHQGTHIGLELYSPKPKDLPSNVRWVADSVGDMQSIRNSSIDLLFSGQNIEHLALQDLTNFLLESNRVINENGLLIIDSPNRSVTQHLGYVQPEHTLELTADEMRSLLDAAGFEVFEAHGLWAVIDPVSIKSFDIFSCGPEEPSAILRKQNASAHPEKSFIWWINARKRNAANKVLVEELAGKIFWRNYPGFVSARFNTQIGTPVWNWGSSTIQVRPADVGYALYGPYIPLGPGAYQAVFRLKSDLLMQMTSAAITLDVISTGGTSHALSVMDVKALNALQGWHDIALPFSLDAYTTAVEARVFCNGFGGTILSCVQFLPN